MASLVAKDEALPAAASKSDQVSMFKDLIVPEVVVSEFEDDGGGGGGGSGFHATTSTPGKSKKNEVGDDASEDDDDHDSMENMEKKIIEEEDCNFEDVISGVVNAVLEESKEEYQVTKEQVVRTVCDVIDSDDVITDALAAKEAESARGGGGLTAADCHHDLKGAQVHRIRSRANTGDSGISLTSITSAGRNSRTTSTCSTDSLFKPLAIVIGEGEGGGGGGVVPRTPASPPHTDTSTLSDVFPEVKTGSPEVTSDAKGPLVVEAPTTITSSIPNVTSPLPQLSPMKEKPDEKCGYFNELFPKLTVNQDKWMTGLPEFDPSKPNRFPGQSMSGYEEAEAFHHRACNRYNDNLNYYDFRNGQFVNADLRRQDTEERAMEKDHWMYHDYYGSDKYVRYRYAAATTVAAAAAGDASRCYNNLRWNKNDSAAKSVDLIEWMVRFRKSHDDGGSGDLCLDLDDDPNILLYEQDIPSSGPERERCDRMNLKFAIKMYNSMNFSNGGGGHISSSNSFPNDTAMTSSNNHGRRLFKPLPPPPPPFIRDRNPARSHHRNFPEFYRNFKN